MANQHHEKSYKPSKSIYEILDMTDFVKNTRSLFNKYNDEKNNVLSKLKINNDCFVQLKKAGKDLSFDKCDACNVFKIQYCSKDLKLDLDEGLFRGIAVSAEKLAVIKKVSLLFKVESSHELQQEELNKYKNAIALQQYLNLDSKPKTHQYLIEIASVSNPLSNNIQFFKNPVPLSKNSYVIQLELLGSNTLSLPVQTNWIKLK